MATATKTPPAEEPRAAFVPIEGFCAEIDGSPVNFTGGATRVSAEWLDQHEQLRHLFRPITFHYDVEQTTAAPGEKRG
jgi:hypothetical protein